MKLKSFFQFAVHWMPQFFKNKIKFFKNRNSFDSLKKNEEEWRLYTLNRLQLKNLVDKNIHFHFFQLEEFSLNYDKEIEVFLKKAKRIEKEKLVLDLNVQDLQQPIVLICERGLISKQAFQELRKKGFINVYFVEGGLQKLLEKSES